MSPKTFVVFLLIIVNVGREMGKYKCKVLNSQKKKMLFEYIYKIIRKYVL